MVRPAETFGIERRFSRHQSSLFRQRKHERPHGARQGAIGNGRRFQPPVPDGKDIGDVPQAMVPRVFNISASSAPRARASVSASTLSR